MQIVLQCAQHMQANVELTILQLWKKRSRNPLALGPASGIMHH